MLIILFLSLTSIHYEEYGSGWVPDGSQECNNSLHLDSNCTIPFSSATNSTSTSAGTRTNHSMGIRTSYTLSYSLYDLLCGSTPLINPANSALCSNKLNIQITTYTAPHNGWTNWNNGWGSFPLTYWYDNDKTTLGAMGGYSVDGKIAEILLDSTEPVGLVSLYNRDDAIFYQNLLNNYEVWVGDSSGPVFNCDGFPSSGTNSQHMPQVFTYSNVLADQQSCSISASENYGGTSSLSVYNFRNSQTLSHINAKKCFYQHYTRCSWAYVNNVNRLATTSNKGGRHDSFCHGHQGDRVFIIMRKDKPITNHHYQENRFILTLLQVEVYRNYNGFSETELDSYTLPNLYADKEEVPP